MMRAERFIFLKYLQTISHSFVMAITLQYELLYIKFEKSSFAAKFLSNIPYAEISDCKKMFIILY